MTNVVPFRRRHADLLIQVRERLSGTPLANPHPDLHVGRAVRVPGFEQACQLALAATARGDHGAAARYFGQALEALDSQPPPEAA